MTDLTPRQVVQEVDPCVTSAIERQVQQEDLINWAQRRQKPFVPVPGVPHTPFKRAPLHAFLSKILP